MKSIQSLSVIVPGNKCINNCACCVSRISNDDHLYINQLENNLPFYDLYLDDYIKRLEFCRDNGCNTLMLTGNIDPQCNIRFLTDFGIMMRLMQKPFRNIEFQTTGASIDTKFLRFLRNHVGVSTISLSMFHLNYELNRDMRQGPPLDIQQICKDIKLYDFNLRISLNLNDTIENDYTPESLIDRIEMLGANQITFRELYQNGDDTPQSKWVREHQISSDFQNKMKTYLNFNSNFQSETEYGMSLYHVDGMSIGIDSDCMSKDMNGKEAYKYFILRPNAKLYSSWDDPASLIF